MTDPSDLRQIRLDKVEKLKEKGVNPFPTNFDKTHTVAEALVSEGKVVRSAGRLFSFREHGNIAFADLKDETGKIQVFFQKKLIGDDYKNIVELLDLGDFIGIEGEVGRTVAGEISIIPTKVTFLSKALRPLPSQWYGLKDTEIRYRQRYLDLLLNPEVRERFNIRTKVISGTREYLNGLGFYEVETPALQPLYGGANAKPFTTHLNALDQDVYLRIAVELYIKRLLVGGYEKVYEIAKDFRNEGIDHTHFPEFTMIEWYEAYVDYQKMMDRAEGLLKFLAEKIYGNTTIQVDDKKIDIGKKWPRISMVDILKERLQLDVENETQESLLAFLKSHCPDVQVVGGETKGQLIFMIFDHLIPKTLIEPTWIIDYPQDISPFAKPHKDRPGWAERFEGYIGGREIFDGWSEITDARVQRSVWEVDAAAARKDKEEAQHIDEDYLTAMEYGMPPYGGIGIGIDRLVMLFTNTWIIKEVILFPTLKRDQAQKEEKKEEKAEEKSSSEEQSSEGSSVPNSSRTEKMNRDEAYGLLTKHMSNKNLLKHSFAAEAAMKGIYKHLHEADYTPETEEMWGITGLLHDVDYEVAQNEGKLEKHGILLFERDPNFIPEPIAHAIKAHNYTKTGVTPETDLDWAITTVDQLTGLVVSTTLIHPDKKLASIDVPFVMKRFNSSGFSRGVDRENIKLCETKLGIPLEKFIEITLTSMQGIAGELGL